MFTGDLERKTYADVESFLAEKNPEGLRLEYKREVTNRIARTIAAMANSEGGLIIIGIEEEGKTGKPKLPPVGIELGKDPITSVRSIAYDNIHEPISDLDIRTYPLPDGENGVLVMRVHRSEHAPHAVGSSHTFLIRVGAQAMKVGTLDVPMNLAQIEWLLKRRERNQQMIDEAMARYESRLLSEPPPDGHYRFDIVAYPAVAHAEPLTVPHLRQLTGLRSQLGYREIAVQVRAVSGGLVSREPVERWSTYFDITGLTARTTELDLSTMPTQPMQLYSRWWVEPSLAMLEWVGRASKEAGWGGSTHVCARLRGVQGVRLELNEDDIFDTDRGEPSIQGTVTASATASVDDLAKDPRPCFAEVLSKLAEAFGREMPGENVLMLRMFNRR